jgi:hypothetical protein
LPSRTPQWSDCRPRRLEAGVLRPARLAARGTALIRLEAVERRAHGNLVGIARPDDEICYFFRRLPCFVGALQPRGVDRALRAWCFCHIVYGAAHRRGDIRLGRKDDARFVRVLADFNGGAPKFPSMLRGSHSAERRRRPRPVARARRRERKCLSGASRPTGRTSLSREACPLHEWTLKETYLDTPPPTYEVS